MIRNFCTALMLYALIAAGSADAQNAGATLNASPADTGALQEVVVTARRFAEDLQSAPLAVAALSAATIQVQDAAELLEWTNARVGRQQRVSDVVWRESLPRNPNGKVLKRELRREHPFNAANMEKAS